MCIFVGMYHLYIYKSVTCISFGSVPLENSNTTAVKHKESFDVMVRVLKRDCGDGGGAVYSNFQSFPRALVYRLYHTQVLRRIIMLSYNQEKKFVI